MNISINVFNIKTSMEAILIACEKLKYPKFTPRNFRQACIVRLLRLGVAPKLIALWQGHSDGGVLIMKVYSQVISDTDDSYAQLHLAKTKV